MEPKLQCESGNPECPLNNGLVPSGGFVPCDICCSEPCFCRVCRCILCCQSMDGASPELSIVRCLARLSGADICGHAAHLKCALDCRMAGVVKQLGLDMEYMCRRCDRKTDLKVFAVGLLMSLKGLKEAEIADSSLRTVLRIIQGSERCGAVALEAFVRAGIHKVQSGQNIEDIYDFLYGQALDALSASSAVQNHCTPSTQGINGSKSLELHETGRISSIEELLNITSQMPGPLLTAVDQSGGLLQTRHNTPANPRVSGDKTSLQSTAGGVLSLVQSTVEMSPLPLFLSEDTSSIVRVEHGGQGVSGGIKDASSSNHMKPSLRILEDGFEEDIRQTLKKLQEAQAAEYALAFKRLNSRKANVLNLYHELEIARLELAKYSASRSLENFDASMERTSAVFKELEDQNKKFKRMLSIEKGFGLTPQPILQELFGLHVD